MVDVPTFSPADLLDTHIQRVEALRPPRDTEHFHGSDYGKCMRMRILKKAKQESTPPSPVSKRRFAVGHIIEKVVMDAFRGAGLQMIAQERLRSPDGRAIGHMDGIIEYGPRRILLDVKSCHGWKFDYLERGERDEGYRRQLGFYHWCWEFAHPDRLITDTLLLYVDKDTIRLFTDWFDGREYAAKVQHEHGDVLMAWRAYEKTGALPDEIPLLPEKERWTGRKRWRTKNGEGLFPSWTCDPRYCGYIHHCPVITAWWKQNPLNEEDK